VTIRRYPFSDEATLSRDKSVYPEGILRKPFDDDSLRIAGERGLKNRGGRNIF